MVVDAVGDPAPYLRVAKETGLGIRYIIDTHVHADHRLEQGLPDYLEVLPGAFAGSVCGRGLSGKPSSTIGFERRFNAAFRIDDMDAFLAWMLREIPPRPPEAERIRGENLGRRSAP